MDFINADIDIRFEARNYITECYSAYEITGLDIYNFHDNDNIALILILYALSQSSLSFAKCEICGHYFVRNINNKSSSQCIRCKEHIFNLTITCDLKKADSLKKDILLLWNESKMIQRNSNKALHCFEKEYRENTLDSFYVDHYEIVFSEIYKPLIKIFRETIDKIIILLSKEYILSYYDSFDVFNDIYLCEIGSQIIQEKVLVAHISGTYSKPEFSFSNYYKNLTVKKFLGLLRKEYEEGVGRSKINELISQLILLLDSYNLNTHPLQDIRKKALSFVDHCYK